VHRGLRWSGELALQTALVLSLWAALADRALLFFLSVYLPGYIAGLGLCWLHGYYEHSRGTTSYYGRLYNLLLFNDGYHAEHHAKPGLHWTGLAESSRRDASTSAWPAPLRWMEAFSLEGLEHLVLRSRVLQRFVLRTHARAFRDALPSVERVAIVGGGLFPRTALILEELLPSARITVIDANRANLDRARALLGAGRVEFVHAAYAESDCAGYDLLVIPLSFDGDREAIYVRPPAPVVIVHDWIWRKRGVSRIVSIPLLKRINLVRR
jgi:Fatty acid desaturase